jgi:hypothetical protein
VTPDEIATEMPARATDSTGLIVPGRFVESGKFGGCSRIFLI